MNNSLDELRKQIDLVDNKLIELLAKRMDIVKKIGDLKKELGQDILDNERWQEIRKKIEQKATEHNINSSFIHRIYQLIHEHAQELEKK